MGAGANVTRPRESAAGACSALGLSGSGLHADKSNNCDK
jgi:hypothetical protein